MYVKSLDLRNKEDFLNQQVGAGERVQPGEFLHNIDYHKFGDKKMDNILQRKYKDVVQ